MFILTLKYLTKENLKNLHLSLHFEIKQIDRVDALREPVMYILKDLMGDPVKGRYYKQQLRAAPIPGVDFKNFEVRF